MARQHFKDGTLNEMIDHKIIEENDIHFALIKGPNQFSLSMFLKITIQCMAETQAECPTIEIESVVKELELALSFGLSV